MRASLVRAQKLVGDPSPLHWLNSFDSVSSRALIPFAHAQKTILPNSMIIRRMSDATLITIMFHDDTEQDYSPISLLSYHRLPCLKVRVTFVADWSIDLNAFFDFVHKRLTITCFSLVKLRASSSGEKALFFKVEFCIGAKVTFFFI